MNNVLASILETKQVLSPEGRLETLHSAIDKQEVVFISRLIKEFHCNTSLEVGCAMGISSLAICEALEKNNPAAVHTIIDPYQRSEWKNVGVYQLERAGFSNFRLVEQPSEFALPNLVQADLKLDFAFIDGWHTFDHTVVDFFYINRLLKPGGILVVDDVQMPAVKKVMRMIHTYPCYRFIDGVKVQNSKKAKLLRVAKAAISPMTKLAGKRLSDEFVDASVVHSDESLGLNSSVVAFQKTTEDNRPWNWFERF